MEFNVVRMNDWEQMYGDDWESRALAEGEERDFALVVEFGEGFRRVTEEEVDRQDDRDIDSGTEMDGNDDGLMDVQNAIAMPLSREHRQLCTCNDCLQATGLSVNELQALLSPSDDVQGQEALQVEDDLDQDDLEFERSLSPEE